jgi:hypothetical protein
MNSRVMRARAAHSAWPLLGAAERHDLRGELAPQKISRRKRVLKNRTKPEVEQAVVDLAIEQPGWARCGCLQC